MQLLSFRIEQFQKRIEIALTTYFISTIKFRTAHVAFFLHGHYLHLFVP